MTSEIILQAIVTGLMMGLIYALIAAGLSLIFGLMDIVNFAHGEHLMLSMFSSFWLWSLFGIDPIFSIPITILLMALCGIVTHYFLIRYIFIWNYTCSTSCSFSNIERSDFCSWRRGNHSCYKKS